MGNFGQPSKLHTQLGLGPAVCAHADMILGKSLHVFLIPP